MSQADCKVMITKTVTSVRKVKLSPSVFLAHAKALENGTAKYPIRRVVCKTFRDISHEKLFSGQLPTRVVVGLVTNEAFNFQHKTDGTELCRQSLHSRLQHAVLRQGPAGKICRDEGIAIDRNDYANGYDLTADLGDEENFNQMRQGSMRLVLKFGQALATTVTLWSM